ncbi:MAG: diphosphomevalonate decarboxylase [Pseudomonadales bacterium]
MDNLEIRTCANIALVKYWGKSDLPGNIPAVGSVSIGLEGLATVTRMQVHDGSIDHITINGDNGGAAVARVQKFLNRARDLYGRTECFEVRSSNNFPTGTGLASSASGFAALALGVDKLLSLGLTRQAVSQLAREGSGSAARSVFGGFVEMHAGPEAFASKITDGATWPLEVVITLTSAAPKETGSTEGMELSKRTSPFFESWINTHEADLSIAREAIAERDFEKLATVSEHSCLKMHATIMASRPGVLYWNGTTIDVIHRVRALRKQGIPVFFTIDAGAQVKVVCMPGGAESVEKELLAIPGVIETISTFIGGEPQITRTSH